MVQTHIVQKSTVIPFLNEKIRLELHFYLLYILLISYSDDIREFKQGPYHSVHDRLI